MTHSEALRDNTAGLVPSSCPGELVPRGRFVELVLAAGGGPRTRTVEVLRCVACLTFVSMAEGRTLNAYGKIEMESPSRP